MIFFKKLRFKNFLSTGNYFTEIELDRSSNTLVIGSNGAGKSTMLDALCFALFGKPFRNINKPQLLNSINQRDCVVEIEFSIGSKDYKIIRGIKPNIFEIYQNGNLINQDAASKDYQEHLEKLILKLNYKSFTQIVILGSASFVPFMQLSAADRRAIIEDLLDIQIFSTMNGLLKNKIATNKEQVTNKKHLIDLANQKFELQKNHIDGVNQNNDEKIKKYNSEIQNHNSTISTLLAKVSTIACGIESLNAEITDKTETEVRIKKITKLESQIEATLQKHRKDISFFQTHDDCPTCKQKIAESFKTNEIERLKSKATSCENGLNELGSKVLNEQLRLNVISEKQKEINKKNVEIATLNTTINQTNILIGRLQELIRELNQNDIEVDSEKNKLDEITKQLVILKQEMETLTDEKLYYDAASILLRDTGIKTKIVKQYLPIINKLVNKYLSSLDFFVNFNLDESFKETIKSRHRDDFSYASFSEGEKQRIDMALMLTWRAVAKLKNSTNTNLLILDEVFDSSLDSNGTEYLMQILHMLDGVNLFVISHKGDILQDKFRSVIRFEKVNNFSRIVK